ncbi:SDR family NAD(P)-dependent oxidoreductase [Wenzhouxiangella marina]|uniref:Short chain dehydrogenase/reductase family oxidoreductase n=1 Tax=Wenzhouxiangella marina TaxID=1579979 RepID=A0A0K0XUK4_9GAMM|nr:SDR family NAD(P)-dependent oxidoreductase [Wenzhouxiangella marina]AKS41363.1 short chain dehydrogenase/reductase family oxidoreductase [Wenzhouxiangella marina]MBB6086885.1 NAD(P)-dependent dehydrogenase (short-subunit alcohol dehydrogenase family) [Wenzhouxiangella marina]
MSIQSRQAESGATALVVGASRGIGLALVEALLADSRFERVIAAVRQPASAEGLAGLEVAPGRSLEWLELDLDRPATIEAVGETLDRRGWRPSLLIHAAGLLHEAPELQPEKRLEDLDAASLARVFAVNTIGPALVLKALLPRMDRDRRAVAAVISARVGSIGDNRLGGWYAYRASKAALNQILRTASIEARRRFPNCILAALHPGTTDTGLSKPFQANVPDEKLFAPSFTAKRLLAVMEGLGIDDSGGFFAWDGQSIPW